VALYKRIPHSFGRNRQIFGYEAYHWGILVLSHGSSGVVWDAYDATDKSEVDKVTWRMTNPEMNWFFRGLANVNPENSSKYLGCIVIGAVEDTISRSALESFFKEIPVPVKNTHPQQSCVTWVTDAIQALQTRGFAEAFDIGEFKDQALAYADRRLADVDPRKTVERSELQR
jgi:hypothetical protein